jgi:hypothetical protein
MLTLDDILAGLLADIDALPVEELTSIIAELAALQARAAMRLRRAPPADVEALLDAKQVAERLGVAPEWVEKRSRTLPFRVSLADGTVRYDPAGLRRWRAGRTGAVR